VGKILIPGPSPKNGRSSFFEEGCLTIGDWFCGVCDNGFMVKHNPPQNTKLNVKLRPIARRMRHEPTQSEALLWERLRDRRLCGYRFHRQHVIDRFIVDFYCSKAALIIEVDGPVHQKQVEADLEREQVLTGLGYHIIRFSNAQVLEQIENVLQHILDAIDLPKTTTS
jgi:very-short-patch-repair endonuclease